MHLLGFDTGGKKHVHGFGVVPLPKLDEAESALTGFAIWFLTLGGAQEIDPESIDEDKRNVQKVDNLLACRFLGGLNLRIQGLVDQFLVTDCVYQNKSRPVPRRKMYRASRMQCGAATWRNFLPRSPMNSFAKSYCQNLSLSSLVM